MDVEGSPGWLIFSEHYPERYGTIGSAVLTLFVLLSRTVIAELERELRVRD